MLDDDDDDDTGKQCLLLELAISSFLEYVFVKERRVSKASEKRLSSVSLCGSDDQLVGSFCSHSFVFALGGRAGMAGQS